MHPEAAFLTGYALVLVAVATGLEWLGRRSADPWSSKVLTASRPPEGRPLEVEVDWPHSEVPVFHLGVSGVALAAALVLGAVSLARHHRPVELVVHVVLLTVIAARIARVVTQHRAPSPLSSSGPGRPRDTERTTGSA